MTQSRPTPAWRRYLRFWGATADADVDDELRFHLDMRIEEYVARGLSPDDARQLATRRFGDAERARAGCLTIDEQFARAHGRADLVTALRQDMAFAVRLLRRQGTATLLAVVCLALGIGATTSMFTVADALLLRPMPYPNGDRLMYLGTARGGEHRANVTSYPDYLDWRARQHAFSDLGAYRSTSLTVLGDEPVLATGLVVSASYFRVLGVTPERGRLFAEGEDAPGGAPVVIVSRSFADRALGGADRAIGRTLVLQGDRAGAPLSRTVVGVMADQSPMPADLWVPIVRNPNLERNNSNIEVIGAVRPGGSMEEANREIGRIEAQLAAEYRENDGDLTAFARPLRDQYVGAARAALEAMFAATLLVLLVACANVAGIQLARAVAREREVAVRGALGAARTRILRQLLTESVMLALAGGLAGTFVAVRASAFATRAVIGNVPGWLAASIDVRVLVFALATSTLTGVIFGVAPAMRLARTDPADALRGGARVGISRPRLQQAFVVAQVALSIVLAVLASLSIQSVHRLEQVDLGFDRTNVLTFKLVFQTSRYDEPAERARTIADVVDRVRALPGVSDAGAVSNAPLTCCSQWEIEVDGHPEPPGRHLMVTGNSITPGYFGAMKIGVRQGRDFSRDDTPSSAPVMIVNQTFANQYWPGGDAVGHRVHFGAANTMVIGVVNDVKQGGLLDSPEPQFYLPVSQSVMTRSAFVMRTSGVAASSLTAQVRRVVHDIDPTLAVFGVRTMDEVVDRETASRRAFESLMVVFGVIALLLAATGIFAVMSFIAAQRRREMGLRLALGADPASVMALMLRQGAGLGLAGAALGVGVAVVAARALAHTLYGVTAGDPTLYLVSLGVATASVLVATVGPARRAARVDPATTLRTD